MLVVKIHSGLGNQLFQYALARQISKKKNMPLKLDISFFKNQNLRSYKLNHYNIDTPVATTDEVLKTMFAFKPFSIPSRIYYRAENILPKYCRRNYKEDELWQYEPNVFKIAGNVYLDGYWQHYKYLESLDKSILDELTLRDEDEIKMYTVFEKAMHDISPVSLHIRRGDTVPDSNMFGVLPLEYYRQAVKYIMGKIKSPSFYIFSDDLNWACDNLEINAPVTFVEIEDGNKDYLELDLMSKCHHHIIANSTFSWWGAYLNQSPEKIVIAPARWVKSEKVNKNVQIQPPCG